MRPSLGQLWCVLACAACGSPERPELASDLVRPEERDDELVDEAPPPLPTHSPCGAATVQLEFIRPNLYFVIDGSGSMIEDIPRAPRDPNAPIGPPLPSDRYGVLSMAVEQLLQRVGHRVNYGVTLFPTGGVACDAGEELLGLTAGDAVSFALQGESGPVLTRLMAGIKRRVPRGGTPVALALRQLLPALGSRSEPTYVFLVTDGGPNCNPGAGCGPEACIPNLENVQLTETLRCDDTLNCCDGSILGPENCLDAQGSLQAVVALADAGVKSFVIGIPGSEVYAEVLDRLAESGGLPRDDSPKYYRVTDAEQLIETVSRLGLSAALGCSIELAEPPEDPSLLNVFFDGVVMPQDPDNGWTFVPPARVRLEGEACTLLSEGQVLQADVVAGCPVIVR